MLLDIKAKWVWPSSYECGPNQYVQFRHEFDLVESIEKAKLIISCDTNYALWINGAFIDCGQYHDFPNHKICDVLEISNLKQGKNVLACLVYYQGEDSFQYFKGWPGLIYQIEAGGIKITSGTQTICRVDPNYKNGEVDRITCQLGYTFEYDARGTDNWREPNYTPGTDWSHLSDVDTTSVQDRPLEAVRPVKKLIFKDRIEPRIAAQGIFVRRTSDETSLAESIQTDCLSTKCIVDRLESGALYLRSEAQEDADGYYLVFDLGREEAGIFDLDIDAAAGTIVDISWGEHLDDLRVRSYVGGRHFASRYICKECRQSFIHHFKRLGGRYVQLNISSISDNVTIYYAGIVPTEYPIEKKGSFTCSDSLHNKIYETCARTLHLCMHDHYEDTPWREQALYAMDMRNQALTGYYCFGEYDFPAASIALLGKSLRDDGFLEMCAPAQLSITIPVFSLAWVLAASDHYHHSGDIDALRGSYPVAKPIVDKRAESMVDGLVPVPCGEQYWHFYDWAYWLDGGDRVLDKKRFDAPFNLFYILALDAVASLAAALGDSDTNAAYQSLADSLRSRVHEVFWDFQNGVYQTYAGECAARDHYCELVQSLAILAGICSKETAAELRKRLATDDNGLVKTTLSYTLYKFEALLTDPGSYGAYVFDQIKRDWGYMLLHGATSFWETINGASDFADAGSLCHGWSGIPAYFYHAYGLGIKPTAPGFAKYDRAPAPNVFDKVLGIVPTPNGSMRI
ncbi:family 78 glycoside hydrolase catalytic domain [bacterium]|nr:family 78 glycoside hydrolase catalytic domain [bacterium]